MASKKRSVLFERNPVPNNGTTSSGSDPEPANRSGIFAVRPDGETQSSTATDPVSSPSTAAAPLDAKALEALVTAHVLSRL